MVGSPSIDTSPKGHLVTVAKMFGVATLGGWISLVLFGFGLIESNTTALLATLFAGSKLVHDATYQIAFYFGKHSSGRTTFFHVLTGWLAAPLLIAAVVLQLWG